MFAVKVGDEVGFARSTHYGFQNTGFATVTKINGHGHITLSDSSVYDKFGNERSKFGSKRLMNPQVLRDYIARDVAMREQTARTRALQQKVSDMFGYSGRAHVTPEMKAELLAMVEAL